MSCISGAHVLFGFRQAVREPFSFLDPGKLVDGDLELVQPDICWIDEQLASVQHPLTQRDMPSHARMTRQSFLAFLQAQPHGLQRGDGNGNAPGYTFWMRLDPASNPPVPIAGGISLRIGESENLAMYLGHIGYHVYPAARGRHLAERACRLLLPLARAHGMKTLWITCNPDNVPSRRTCERLGGIMVEIVPVPRANPLYWQGDREKCRYRLDL